MAKRRERDGSISYLFVVDTNCYAGNFERELCAYMTGEVGDCGVGDAEAACAKKEAATLLKKYNLEELVVSVPDENGCCRPAVLVPNSKYGNDGMGKEVLLTAENRTKYHYPAYFSVGIHLRESPQADISEFLKGRANAYAAEHGIVIEGFRLLEHRLRRRSLPI